MVILAIPEFEGIAIRQCLIDADVLLYEIGFAAEAAWKHASPNSEDPPPWDFVEELLHKRIEDIEFQCEATTPSIFFLTGNGNFRNALAKRVPYKSRPSHKPWHYKNIKAFIRGTKEYRIQDGLEADDLMSIEQTVRGDETIICTRDKDLGQLHGFLFRWELGASPQIGPLRVSGFGTIQLSDDRKKITGFGPKFFLAQCLIGDRVDSIPGLPKCGPVAAFDALSEISCYKDGLSKVSSMYETVFRDRAKEELLEQGRLLWMTRRLDEQGQPILWDMTDDFTEEIERSCQLQ